MPIDVGELVAMPHLALRVLAGGRGLGREVTWSHTSDLPDPWRWVSRGELLMTNGMSFPAREAEQLDVLRKLEEVGVSALAIGEEMSCPPLTDGFLAAADERGLPVLAISYPMPFAAISRTIAEGSLPEQSRRVASTARIYDAIRHAAGASTDRSCTAPRIGEILGAEVHVCDARSAEAYYPLDDAPPPEVAAVIADRGPGSMNRVVRREGGTAVFLVQVPTHAHAVLALRCAAGSLPDPNLLQHAATVVALELTNSHLEIEHERRAGAELSAQIIDGRGRRDAAARELRARSIEPARAVVVAAAATDHRRLLDLHLVLWRRQVPHALVLRGDVAHVVLAAEHAGEIAAALGAGGIVGTSRRLESVDRAAEADREAMWALGTARSTGLAGVVYGTASPRLVPGDSADARALVAHRLGAVLRYDQEHGTDLVRTLEVFLDEQRSWTRTAAALDLHPQSVRYRIRRVEQLAGVDLRSSAEIAGMWLAIQARRMLDGEGG